MNESYHYITLFGLKFNPANDLAILLSSVLIFALVFWLSRNPQVRPTKRQNVLEYIIDFTNGIVKDQMPGREGGRYGLFAFVLFLFVFFNNQVGLFLQIDIDGDTWFRSATADPMMTMTIALMVMVLSHFFGVVFNGFIGYLKAYASPVAFLLPINILENFTNFVTLSMRLYGNIFAGEVLLLLIKDLAFAGGPLPFVAGVVIEVVWQGFSVFIGSIQAYIFVTLSTVYTSEKVLAED